MFSDGVKLRLYCWRSFKFMGEKFNDAIYTFFLNLPIYRL